MPRLAHRSTCVCSASRSTASAQSIAIDEFRPAIDSRGYLTLNASQTLGHERDVVRPRLARSGAESSSRSSGRRRTRSTTWSRRRSSRALGLHVGQGAARARRVAAVHDHDDRGSRGDPSHATSVSVDGSALPRQGTARARRPLRRRRDREPLRSDQRARDPFLGEAATTPQLIGDRRRDVRPRSASRSTAACAPRTTTFMDRMGARRWVDHDSTALPVGVAAACGDRAGEDRARRRGVRPIPSASTTATSRSRRSAA